MLKYNSELRKLIFGLLGLDIGPSEAESELLAKVDSIAKEFISAFLLEEEPLEAANRLFRGKFEMEETKSSI